MGILGILEKRDGTADALWTEKQPDLEWSLSADSSTESPPPPKKKQQLKLAGNLRFQVKVDLFGGRSYKKNSRLN